LFERDIYRHNLYYKNSEGMLFLCVLWSDWSVDMCFFRVVKKNHGISFVSLSLCPERHRIELEKILEFGLDGRLCDV